MSEALAARIEFPLPESLLAGETQDVLRRFMEDNLRRGRFCPPFASVPQLDFEQADGPPARVKLGQLLAYGARFEVKLDAPGPAEILIAFSARGETSATESRRLRSRNPLRELEPLPMARWPRHTWTSIYTYATVFLLFPLLCLLAYGWVRGWFSG